MTSDWRTAAGSLDSTMDDRGAAGQILVSTASRRLRRELRPLSWMVLEEIALDVIDEDGRLVAYTSARRLAEDLRIDPGTVANALRALRQMGLLTMERTARSVGRFGLAVYVLGTVDGLSVVAPCVRDRNAVEPHRGKSRRAQASTVEPHMAAPHTAEPCVGAAASTEQPPGEPTPDPQVPYAESGLSAGPPNKQRAEVVPEGPAQEALNLGLGSA